VDGDIYCTLDRKEYVRTNFGEKGKAKTRVASRESSLLWSYTATKK
jgi:hypothetical protein